MHTCYVIAFLLAAGAALAAAAQRGWPFAMLAGGFAAYVAPVAFELTR